jgi:hypothetical protein
MLSTENEGSTYALAHAPGIPIIALAIFERLALSDSSNTI